MRLVDIIDEGTIKLLRKAPESPEKVNEIQINNTDGLGATQDNRDVDTKGLRVLMRPKTFLRLAAPQSRKNSNSVSQISHHLSTGGAIASPFLVVNIPQEWNNGDFSKVATIMSHDGRNRMWAVQEEEGNDPIEVHIFFNDSSKVRPEWIEHIKKGLISQGSNNVVRGPLFKMGHSDSDLDEVYPGQSSGKLKNWIKNHYGGAINCTKAARLKNDSNASTFYKKRASWYQSLHCKGNKTIR